MDVNPFLSNITLFAPQPLQNRDGIFDTEHLKCKLEIDEQSMNVPVENEIDELSDSMKVMSTRDLHDSNAEAPKLVTPGADIDVIEESEKQKSPTLVTLFGSSTAANFLHLYPQ